MTRCGGLAGFADVITVSKVNCAARMNYFEQLLITLLLFKFVLVVVVGAAYAAPRVARCVRERRRWSAVPHRMRASTPTRRQVWQLPMCLALVPSMCDRSSATARVSARVCRDYRTRWCRTRHWRQAGSQESRVWASCWKRTG